MNVPKLRFKEFSDEWESVSFGKFFDFLQTNSFSREIASSTTGTIRNIHYGDILTKLPSIIDLNEIELPFLDSSIEMKNEVLNKSIIKDGDIVIADTAEDYAAGMTCEVIGTKEKAVLSGLHTMLCRKKGGNLIALGYLGYYMNTPSYHNQLLPLIVGSKVYSINKNEIKKTVLSMPEFVEQEKIVDLLRTVDKKINSLKKSIDLLNKQKKGFMQKIFSQKLRFKDDKGEEFPDWEEKKLGEVGEIITGKTPDTNTAEFWNGDIQFITPVDMGNGKYLRTSERTVTEKVKMKILQIGTVMVTCIGATIGKMAIITRKAITNQQINTIYSDTANNEFLYYALLNIVPQIRRMKSNTTMPILNKSEFSALCIKLPCADEQNKIARFLSLMDEKIEKENACLEHWQQIKKGLLQQMFV